MSFPISVSCHSRSQYNKKFIIIGNDNCRTYKEVFKLIKSNNLWCGYNHVKEFVKADGNKQQFGNVSWYTNVEITKRYQRLDLYKKYSPDEYPKYDNYDAIEVSKVSDIPVDYDAVMGVPITFLDKHNPTQFEIVGLLNSSDTELAGTHFSPSNNKGELSPPLNRCYE